MKTPWMKMKFNASEISDELIDVLDKANLGERFAEMKALVQECFGDG